MRNFGGMLIAASETDVVAEQAILLMSEDLHIQSIA
jgi:hypothetical protein